MMSATKALRQIAVDQVPPQPWRNGGGVTRELFAWPNAAHWQWRISVADISADGPFSAYPGLERWLAVVEGRGLVLRFGEQRQVLECNSDPCHFDGGQTPMCKLQSGATRDLNLMSQRSVGRSRMLRVQAADEWHSRAPLRALFTTETIGLQIDDDDDAARLPAWTLAVSQHAQHQRWRVITATQRPSAWWMEFQPL